MTVSRIAVISDSHDHSSHLEKAVFQINGSADLLIHCGDLCAPSMMKHLAQFDGNVHLVCGNADKELVHMKQVADQFQNLRFYPHTADIRVDGVLLGATHLPRTAQKLAQSGKYSVVFYGHTHEFSMSRFDEVMLVNCGDIYGRKHHPSYLIYDLNSGDVEQRPVEL